MASLRISITGIDENRRRAAKILGAVVADDVVGMALKDGADIFGESIKSAYMSFARRSKGKKARKNWKRVVDTVKIGHRAKKKDSRGPVYFSAADRSARVGSPQSRWLHHGTKHQAARPEIFNNAVTTARTRARNAVRARLKVELAKFGIEPSGPGFRT